MKLEQEAKAHVESRNSQFYEELARRVSDLELHINKSLWHSEEKDKALEHVTSFVLWAKHCVKVHGIR